MRDNMRPWLLVLAQGFNQPTSHKSVAQHERCLQRIAEGRLLLGDCEHARLQKTRSHDLVSAR